MHIILLSIHDSKSHEAANDENSNDALQHTHAQNGLTVCVCMHVFEWA